MKAVSLETIVGESWPLRSLTGQFAPFVSSPKRGTNASVGRFSIRFLHGLSGTMRKHWPSRARFLNNTIVAIAEYGWRNILIALIEGLSS